MKMKKISMKVISGLATTAILASLVSPASASSQFKDIPNGHWSEEAVNYGVSNGYINGLPDGSFGLGNSITRQDASVMIASALYGGKDKIPQNTLDFSDVSNDNYAANAIASLVELGAISGYGDGTFKPKKTITREEFAKILVNAFNLSRDYDYNVPEFSDVSYDRWSKEYIDILTQFGVGGVGQGKFAPKNLVTREQAAQFIYSPHHEVVKTGPITADAYHNISVHLEFGILTDIHDVKAEDIQIEGLDVLEVVPSFTEEYLIVSTSKQVEGKEYSVSYLGEDTRLTFTGVPQYDKDFGDADYGVDEEGPYVEIVMYDHEATNIDLELVKASDFQIDGLNVNDLVISYMEPGYYILYIDQPVMGQEYNISYKGEDTGASFVGGPSKVESFTSTAPNQLTITFESEISNIAVEDLEIAHQFYDENFTLNTGYIEINSVEVDEDKKTLVITTNEELIIGDELNTFYVTMFGQIIGSTWDLMDY